MIYRWLSRGWLALGVLFVLLAILVTLVRVGGPVLDQNRARLLDYLLADSHISASVERISLNWYQAGPAVALQKLSIAPHSGQFKVQLDKVLLKLDFWRSVKQFKPIFADVIFEQGDIKLDLSANTPDDNKQDKVQQDALLRFVLTQLSHFRLNNTRFQLRSALGQWQLLHIAKLHWQNRDNRHQGVGKAYLVDGVGKNALDLIIDVNAPQMSMNKLAGTFYLQASKLDITALVSQSQQAKSKLTGVVDFQLWSEFANGQLGDSLLRFGKNQLHWTLPQSGESHRLALQGGQLQLRHDLQGWQLASHDITLTLDGKPWSEVDWQFEQVGDKLQGYIAQIDLQKVAQLAPLLACFSPAWGEKLKQTQPRGYLQDLLLQGAARDWSSVSLTGQLNKLKVTGWRDVPGIGNLNGAFWLNQQGGSAQFNLQNDTFSPGHHLREAIPIDRFSARLDWWRTAQGWVFYGNDIVFDNPDLQLASHFRFDNFSQPFLALSADVDVKDASRAYRYFPLQVMDKSLVDYLSGAIKGGKAQGVKVNWYGKLADFPYRKGEGIFQVFVPLQQASYEFFPGWPLTKELQIDLLFKNDGLDMVSHSSQLGQVHGDFIHAQIPRFADGHLLVDGKVSGDGKAVSDYLQKSPLANTVGKALAEVVVQGPISGTLKLDIPLTADGGEVKVSGDALFDNNPVRIRALNLPLTRVKGRLEYDNQQTRLSNLTAELWGQPITVNYQGRQQPDRYQLDLDFKGQWQSRRQIPEINAFGIFNGQAPWSGKLALTLRDNKPFSFQFALDSSLRGMALDLPVPLNKVRESEQSLRVIARGQEGSAEIRGNLGQDVNLQGRLVYGEASPYLSHIRLDVGQPGTRVLREAPMLVTINQQQADVAGWIARLRQWLPVQQKVGNALVGPAFMPQDWWVDGQLAQANIGSAILKAVRFTIGPINQATEVMIDSPDVMGVIRIPMVENRPIDAKFARIFWSGSSTDLRPAADTQHDLSIMAAMPWLRFSCVDCRFGKTSLGELKGELIPSPNKVTLRGFNAQLAASQLNANVEWLRQGEQMSSRAWGKLTTKSSENLIKRLGYPSPLSDAPGSLSFDLTWQDVPYRASAATLAGKADYRLEGGTLWEINDKGARLFSLLSLDSLLRKLRLDFRDVFDKGFYFESMSASATVKQGIIETKDFYMKGAAGNLRAEGLADLVRWRLDYDLSFSPNLGGTLPLIAAFSITPITGLYVLALSKLLEPVVDVITRIDFRISGSINDPQLVEAGRHRARIKLNAEQKQAVDAVAPTLPAKELTPFLLAPKDGQGLRH